MQFAILGYPKVFNKQLLAQLTLMVLGRCRNFFHLSWFGLGKLTKVGFVILLEMLSLRWLVSGRAEIIWFHHLIQCLRKKINNSYQLFFPRLLNNSDLERLVQPQRMTWMLSLTCNYGQFSNTYIILICLVYLNYNVSGNCSDKVVIVNLISSADSGCNL